VETFTSEIGDPINLKMVYFPIFELVKPPQKTEGPVPEEPTPEEPSKKNLEVRLVKLKAKSLLPRTKEYSKNCPPGPLNGFFGLNTIPQDATTLVITEGELDAMSVHQQTGYPAISLPQRARVLPGRILPYLNQFTKLILWMASDEAGKFNL
jgi:twinkle protein